MENKTYAVVVQVSRKNTSTGNSVLYVLGVKLTQNKMLADQKRKELEEQGYVIDVVTAENLPDLQ